LCSAIPIEQLAAFFKQFLAVVKSNRVAFFWTAPQATLAKKNSIREGRQHAADGHDRSRDLDTVENHTQIFLLAPSAAAYETTSKFTAPIDGVHERWRVVQPARCAKKLLIV